MTNVPIVPGATSIPQVSGRILASIPWSSILGDGERPLVGRTDRDGKGLVVLIGNVGDLAVLIPSEAGATAPAPATADTLQG